MSAWLLASYYCSGKGTVCVQTVWLQALMLRSAYAPQLQNLGTYLLQLGCSLGDLFVIDGVL